VAYYVPLGLKQWMEKKGACQTIYLPLPPALPPPSLRLSPRLQ
jgi:hypothetical protein